MAKKFFNSVSNAFTGVFALVFFVAVCMFSSCSDDQGAAKLPTLTNVITEPGDTVEVIKNDTVVIDRNWTVNVSVENRVDTIDVTTEISRPGESHIFKGKVFIYPKKTGYQIFADQEILTPEYANNGRTGGKTVREQETDSSWVDVTRYYYPTEDGNVVIVEAHMEHLKNKPYVRVNDSEILSLVDPSMSTRALYKVKDAPIKATDLVTFEVVSAEDNRTFSEEISCGFDREMMAEDDIDHLELVSKGTKPVDPTTVSDSVKVAVVMKSGSKNEVVNYNVRKNEFTAITFEPAVVNDFAGYGFGNVIGISAFEAEKEVAERSTGNWSVYSKKDVYSAAIAGEKPFNTKYYLQTERAQYKDEKWGIEASFDYITPEVKEEGTNLNTVTSDRSGYDKAVVTNNIAVKYAGFTTPLSETKALYKEAVIERKIVDEDWDEAKKKVVWAPTSTTYKAVYYILWNDGVREETPFEWVQDRLLTPGEYFERLCKDDTNRTGRPSIIDLKTSPIPSHKENGAVWNGVREEAVIGTTVSFNGAENADVLYHSSESNDVSVEYRGKTLKFGHYNYDFTLTPNLGSGSVKDGFTVYPYTAVLNYKFGDAAAKQATDKGSLKVAVPEEKRFFRKEWGDLESVEQTTTMSKDMKSYAYVWSLHFFNKETGKRYVLPVVLEKDAPQKPLWDFSLVEECEKSKYDKYNSAFYDPRSKSWKNAWAEDAREWLQWSLAEEGSAKKAYGTTVYETAKAKGWDTPSYISGRPTVFTHRYDLTVKDGRLFATDTYNSNAKITDSNCVNGGWK